MLRQFLYLDHPLVRDFLSSLEGGVFDESRNLTSREGKRGIEGRAGLGTVGVGAQGGSARREESEAVVHQTAASEFERLYNHLEDGDMQVYDRIDVPLEDLPIQRRDIIEVDARLQVSGLHALTDLMRMFGQVAPLIQQFGGVQQVDPDMLAGMHAFTALTASSSTLSVIGTAHGDTQLALALELQLSGVRTESWDVEATALMKVQRLLRPGQSELVGDPFGGLMKALPETQRRELVAGLQADELGQFGVGSSEIRYPAIVGTPIAIYR